MVQVMSLVNNKSLWACFRLTRLLLGLRRHPHRRQLSSERLLRLSLLSCQAHCKCVAGEVRMLWLQNLRHSLQGRVRHLLQAYLYSSMVCLRDSLHP